MMIDDILLFRSKCHFFSVVVGDDSRVRSWQSDSYWRWVSEMGVGDSVGSHENVAPEMCRKSHLRLAMHKVRRAAHETFHH